MDTSRMRGIPGPMGSTPRAPQTALRPAGRATAIMNNATMPLGVRGQQSAAMAADAAKADALSAQSISMPGQQSAAMGSPSTSGGMLATPAYSGDKGINTFGPVPEGPAFKEGGSVKMSSKSSPARRGYGLARQPKK